MPTISESVVIDRPAAAIWKHMIEPERVLLWNSNMLEFEQLGEGPVSKGTRHRAVIKAPGRRMDVISEITECDEARLLAWRSVEAPFDFEMSQSLETVDGGTRLSWTGHTDSMGGFFGKLADPLVVRMFSRDVRSNLQHLKEILESEA